MAAVGPTPTPKLISHFGETFRSMAGKNLLLLIVQAGDVGDAAVVRVVLNAAGDLLREIVADLHRRRKIDAEIDVGPVPGAFQRRIHGKVPASRCFIDDGPNLPRPRVRRKLRALVADLDRQAYAHRPVPTVGHAHARPDVVAHPLHAQPALLAGEDVKANFGPVVDPLRDFDRLVFGVIGGRTPSIAGCPSAVKFECSSTIVVRGATVSAPYT